MATTASWTVYFLIDPTHDSPKMAPALDFLDIPNSVPGTVAAELMATIDAWAPLQLDRHRRSEVEGATEPCTGP